MITHPCWYPGFSLLVASGPSSTPLVYPEAGQRLLEQVETPLTQGVFASAASESAFFHPGGSRTQVYSPTSKWLG